MGFYRRSLIVLAASCFVLALATGPAAAQSAKALPRSALAAAGAQTVTPLAQHVMHRRRSQSFYCYPKKHWWFYRPYTTAQENYPRCMPYFHYLDGPASRRRGAGGGQYFK